VLTGGPGGQGARARSGIHDLGHAIKIRRERSDWGGGRTAEGGAAPLRGGEVAGVEAGAC
jgi:hypothetical protein